MADSRFRKLPSIDAMLRAEVLQPLIADAGRASVREALRETIAQLRSELAASPDGEHSPEGLIAGIESRVRERFARRKSTRTRRVINATGVVLHTNLGRAPLGRRSLAAINEVAAGYCNLEFDLTTGNRGRRGAGLEAMLRELFGCEAATVVNNCAAAVLVAVNTLAEGGEVIVSRGELIEIGGAFRLPDVIAKSGARLREVGTTNRTRLADYENAITAETRAILRAHPSNYRIIGFTERPALEELSGLARSRNLPLIEDLGSGALVDLRETGIRDEPTVGESLKAGASVVAFSGDKLLGGPQAGLLLGDERFIRRIERNPLGRALRVDKLIYAALEATIEEYAAGRAETEIPVQAMLRARGKEIALRVKRFLRRAQSVGGNVSLRSIDGASAVGGGSAPGAELPTRLIVVEADGLSASEIERRLRLADTPVIARILDDRVVLDLRTVGREDEAPMIDSIATLNRSTAAKRETKREITEHTK
ncbi:MAG: L-seryl-tRNA(Sec) selenium transferase [Blastocatellales bacterium]|nr:L-seryl-tRNA(Sec) selenium transferase [Blastocatellales bacterium]